MIGILQERERVAIELIGAITGLIKTNSVPEYMVEFLEARVAEARRAYGLHVAPIERDPQTPSIAIAGDSR